MSHKWRFNAKKKKKKKLQQRCRRWLWKWNTTIWNLNRGRLHRIWSENEGSVEQQQQNHSPETTLKHFVLFWGGFYWEIPKNIFDRTLQFNVLERLQGFDLITQMIHFSSIFNFSIQLAQLTAVCWHYWLSARPQTFHAPGRVQLTSLWCRAGSGDIRKKKSLKSGNKGKLHGVTAQ